MQELHKKLWKWRREAAAIKGSVVIIIGATAAIALGIFVAMAQVQDIIIPYFTPTRIEFQDLEGQYAVNSSMAYTISLKGYGSNCIAFEAAIFREVRPDVEERVTYYSQMQDCRKINILPGQYNYTKSFSYSGNTVLGKPSDYTVDINVLDQITRQIYADSYSFIVVEYSP